MTLLEKALQYTTSQRFPNPPEITEEEVDLLLAYIRGDVNAEAYAKAKEEPNRHVLFQRDALRVLKYLFFNMRIKGIGEKDVQR